MGLLSTFGAASGRAFGLTRVGAAIKDAYFNLTTLLLPGNGTNGAQNNTFLDSSTNNFTITRNGNTTQGTFSPFSQTGWSNYFNSVSDYLGFTSISLGASFTFEFFVFFPSAPSSQNVIISNAAGGGTNWIGINATDITFSYSGTNRTFSFAAAAGTWYYVQLISSSSSVSCYVNGTQRGTAQTGPATFSVDRIGGYSAAGFSGYLSNLRAVNSALSVSTTPTSPLTAITGTQLLTCQSNRFIDNSTNNYAITVTGSPSVQAFSPFAPTAAYSAATNGGSGYFDGTGDYLSIADNAALDMGASDFTMECFVYLTETPSSADGIFAKRTDINTFGGVIAYLNGTTPNFYATVNGSSWGVAISSSIALRLNSWNHLAFTRSGNTWTVWVNGASGGTATVSGTVPDNASAFVVGAYSSDGNATYLFPSGYISNARVVKGTAVYTAAFTPPTSPLTAITNTSLLLDFTNAGITDATAKNDLETVGNAQISTTQSKFGGSSMYFDGTGDRLTTRFVPPQDLSGGNWTIEFWMNLGASVPTTFRSIAGASNGGGSVPKWILILNANTSYTYQANRLMFATYNGADRQLNIGFTWATNTWYHIAIVCSSGTTSIYIDGVSQGSMAYNIGSGITNGIVIGADGETYSEFTGYIDDFRVTKGYARYTANFSAPTAAFALQ